MDNTDIPKRAKTGMRVIPRMLITAFILAVCIWLGFSLFTYFTRELPSDRIPAGFDVYAHVPSVSTIASKVIHLPAVDIALGTPDTMELRGLIRALRLNPALRSRVFLRLANVRADVAFYPDGDFALAADIGLIGSNSWAADLYGRAILNRFHTVDNLMYVSTDPHSYYKFQTLNEAGETSQTVYAAIDGHFAFASSSLDMLHSMLAGTSAAKTVEAALDSPDAGTIQLLLAPERFLQEARSGDDLIGRIVSRTDLAEFAAFDISLSAERIGLRIRSSASSSMPELGQLLEKRSSTPAILSRLPAGTEYFSLLKLGTPQILWNTFAGFLDTETLDAKNTADRAARAAFGGTIDDLIFAWMGDEFGAFGTEFGPAPVFFTSIQDEHARRDAFSAILNSFLVGQDDTAVVDGQRMSRIVFPRFIRRLLSTLDIQLAEPFYFVENDMLFMSESAETLGAVVRQMQNEQHLVGTKHWRTISESISSQSSAMVYYNLNRSMPFFLRGGSSLNRSLRGYALGAVNLEIGSDGIQIQQSAISTKQQKTANLPGYPLQLQERIDSQLLTITNRYGSPLTYWTSGSRVHGLDLAAGMRYQIEMDDTGWLSMYRGSNNRAQLWAVSSRGSIYLLDSSLEPLDGFPVLLGSHVSGQPVAIDDRLYIPLRNGSIQVIDSQRTRFRSTEMHSHSRSAPAVYAGYVAVLPRSFDSQLYVFNSEGSLLEGWPVALDGIASSSPVITSDSNRIHISAITESGLLYSFTPDGETRTGFPIQLPGVFSAQPQWDPLHRSFVLASEEGTIWRVSLNGDIMHTGEVTHIEGRGIELSLFDINNNNEMEIFVGNESNVLLGLRQDMVLLPDFPLAGSGTASFADVDGSGTVELILAGTDNRIHVYSFGLWSRK